MIRVWQREPSAESLTCQQNLAWQSFFTSALETVATSASISKKTNTLQTPVTQGLIHCAIPDIYFSSIIHKMLEMSLKTAYLVI